VVTVPPITAATEEYNGTTWTNSGNLNTARYDLAGAGTQTAGLAFGGYGPVIQVATEEYDGSTWTTSRNFKYSKTIISRCRNTNISFSIWW
jgi:hypothetical protein